MITYDINKWEKNKTFRLNSAIKCEEKQESKARLFVEAETIKRVG